MKITCSSYFVLFHLLYFVFFKKQAFLGRLLVNINKDGDGDVFFVICESFFFFVVAKLSSIWLH